MRHSYIRICSITLYILIITLLASVFYFSWLPSPDIGSKPYFPKFFGGWINTYGNVRAAIPFILLGALSEFSFKSSSKVRLLVCMGLVTIVTIAELGQLFLAKKHFDLADIGWGIAGSVFGIALGELLKLIKKLFITTINK